MVDPPSVLESIPDALIIIDAASECYPLNDAGRELFDRVSLADADLSLNSSAPHDKHPLVRAFKGETLRDVSLALGTSAGEVSFTGTVAPVRSPGGDIVGVLVIVRTPQ